MRFVSLLTATLCVCVSLPAASFPSGTRKTATPIEKTKWSNAHPRMPLVFEPNVGQAPQDVAYISRTLNGTVLLNSTGATLLTKGVAGGESTAVRMLVKGAKESAAEPSGKLLSYSNYFIGADAGKWRTGVPHYSQIRFKSVYPGIELVYYGTERRLEYDFIVAPGVNPEIIEVAFQGADKLTTDRNGDLLIEAAGQTIKQSKPLVYQIGAGGKRELVAAGYRISRDGDVQFALSRYDRSRELVIDPVLQFATYLGGSGYDVGVALTTDSAGSLYMAGQTNSGTFQSSGAAQAQIGGASDAIVAKFSSTGDSLQWVSYFGGSESEFANGVAVDSGGNVVIVGWTLSQNMPTKAAAQSALGGGLDAFVAKFNPMGTDLVWATYLGGAADEFGIGLATDGSGAAYATGWTTSANFPLTGNAFQRGPSGGGRDVFVTKIPAAGAPFFYSTYVGGNGEDVGTKVAVDAQGNAYVTGSTTSTAFATAQPIQAQNGGGQDSFLFKLTADGGSLAYSTFLGGSSDDLGYGVAVDGARNAYVSGYTQSANFPVRNPLQSAAGGGFDAFVYKVNAAGTALEYSTFVGGNSDDYGLNIVVDAGGSAYLTGWTASANFPSRNPSQTAFGGGRHDAFVARIAPAGNALLYSTLIGGSGNENAYGIALDRQGNVTVSGWTSSRNFPSATGALTIGNLEDRDIFVARLSADTSVTLIGASPSSLTFSGRSGAANPAPQTIDVTSTSPGVQFSAGSNVPWLTVATSGNATPAQLTVSVNLSAIGSGQQSGEITINAPSASTPTIRIPVAVMVEAVPVITAVTPNPLPRGTQSVQITITGSDFPSNSLVFLNNAQLQTTVVNGTSLTAIVPPSIIPVASSSVQLTVRTGANTSAAFLLPVSSGQPVISQGGVVNAATNLASAVSPGLLVTIYGTAIGPETPTPGSPNAAGVYPTTLGETRVLFDGIAAPLTDARGNQVNAIVPYAVAGRGSVQVEVEVRGQKSAPITVSVAPATPGLFTSLSTGSGQVAAVNENGGSNSASNAAARGSVVVMYATGLGETNPAGVDGRLSSGTDLARPMLPVTVTIGGIQAEVLYSGAAPNLVSGVFQLNVRVPQDATAGPSVPVVVRTGNAGSREDVTLAVQ